MSDLVIGVDGGGTKTVAWLAPLDDTSNTVVLGRGQAGPGNPRSVGFDVTQQNIASAIGAAFADAKLPVTTASAACFGLAGAGRASEQERIAAWAQNGGIASAVRVAGDAEPILAAASPENCGIALICGTGSLAWGRNREGQTARCGGWGHLLGDEGSGYKIALAGLRSATLAADGRGPATDLLPAFMRQLSAESPPELIEKVYAPEMSRERLAGLASIVFDCRTTDEAARKIIDDAAGDLAEMVGTLAARLGFLSKCYPLAMAGGVLMHQLNFLEEVINALHDQQRSKPVPDSWFVVEEPVRGAVALARTMAQRL